jgi:hypothetical protein
VLDHGSGATLLSTNDLDFGWRAGPSFLLGYRPTPMDAWELSYFGMMDWTSQQSISESGIFVPGVLGNLPFFDDADLIQTTYASRIDNAELNYFWHHGCPDIMWMAGFRYFHLDERLDILSTETGSGSSLYDIRTGNDLAGGQLGVRFRHCCTRFEGDLTAKAGAFGNSVGQSQTVGTVGLDPLRSAGNHTADWAFVGDIGLNASYYICKNWCVMAGYNVMWVDGVALAPDQLDFTNNPDSGRRLDRNGSVLYQGAHVGLGCHW